MGEMINTNIYNRKQFISRTNSKGERFYFQNGKIRSKGKYLQRQEVVISAHLRFLGQVTHSSCGPAFLKIPLILAIHTNVNSTVPNQTILELNLQAIRTSEM